MNMELIKSKTLDAIEIAEFIIETMQSNNVHSIYPTLQDFSVNPFYNQISEESSLVIEEYYGLPNKVYTPLGYICLTSNYTYIDNEDQEAVETTIYKALKDKFNFTLYKEAANTSLGIIGGWYTIDGQPFTQIRQFDHDVARNLFSEWLDEYISNKNK